MKLELKDDVFECLYSYASHVNNRIMAKSNNDEELSFFEHYSFQISSYLLTIILEQLFSKSSTSITTFFIYRCLIENIAILKMYEAGDIEEDCFELLNDYNYIIEYIMYNRFSQLDGKLFYIEQMENNYNNVLKKYKDNINYTNSKELKTILRSRLPWLKNEYSFDEIIKMYCPELYDFYKYLSVTIHPADPFTLMPILENEKFENLFMYISDTFIKFASKYIDDDTTITESIQNDYGLILSGPSELNPNHIYLSYAQSQGDILIEISEMVREKFGDNSNSDYLKIYKDILESIALDKTFGLTELIKCKMKPFFELVAGNDYQLESTHSIKGERLFGMHSLYNYYRSVEDYNSCEGIIKSLLECYTDVSMEEMEKKMKTTLGFLNEKKSLTRFINDYLDNLETIGFESLPASLESNETIDLKDFAKLCYEEANALSHANGYMIIANTGAFSDYFYPIIIIDICIINILSKISAAIEYFGSMNKINVNKLKYELNKRIKQYYKLMEKKFELDIRMNPFKIQKK